jgi:hypothetical protein
MIHWIVQNAVFNDTAMQSASRLINHLWHNRQTFSVVRLGRSGSDPYPDISIDGKVVVVGSPALLPWVKTRGFDPGVWLSPYMTARECLVIFGNEYLNYDSRFMPICSLLETDVSWSNSFIYPNTATTSIRGQSINSMSLESTLDQWLNSGQVTMADVVGVTSIKSTSVSYRFVVVNGVVITGSQYRIHGKPITRLCSDSSQEFIEASRFAKLWPHDEVFVLDLDAYDGRLKVASIHPLNLVGWYDCDVGRITTAIDNFVSG